MHKEEVPKALRVKPAVGYANENGRQAARMGLSRDVNPWPEGTALHRSWDVGWRSAAHAATGERNPSTKG